MRGRNGIAMLAPVGWLVAWLAACIACRAAYVEPAGWAALCQAGGPAVCAPRQAMLWMQYHGLWGGAALVLGLGAFLGAPLAMAAIATGIAAVVNYNASFGMLGAALGAWIWIIGAKA